MEKLKSIENERTKSKESETAELDSDSDDSDSCISIDDSSSEEEAAQSSLSEVLGSREEVTLHAVVSLIKIDAVHLNTSLSHTSQAVVGGEDDLVHTTSHAHAGVNHDLLDLGAALVAGLAAVDVESLNVSHTVADDLHILFTELVSQEDAGGNHNDGDGAEAALKATHGVSDAHQGLAAASGDDDLTFASTLHSSHGSGLMRAESESHGCVLVCVIHTIKPPGAVRQEVVTLL